LILPTSQYMEGILFCSGIRGQMELENGITNFCENRGTEFSDPMPMRIKISSEIIYYRLVSLEMNFRHFYKQL
jgi:hypothetical protein